MHWFNCPPRYEEAILVWRQVMRGDFLVVLDRLLPLMGRDGATFLTRLNSTPSTPDYKAISQTLVDRHGIARAWSEFLAQYAGNGNARSPRPLWSAEMFEVGANVLKLRDDCLSSACIWRASRRWCS